jgi:hypothetical protein
MFPQLISPRSTGLALAQAADRVPAKLVNGARTSGVLLIARATVQISVGAATALRNRGSVWSLFDRLYINENGRDVSTVRGNVLRYASELQAPSSLSAQRVSSTGVGTYVLEEAAYFQFAHPLSLDPLETAYTERDTRQDFSVQFTMAQSFAGKLATAGGATIVVTGVNVDVIQDFELQQGNGATAPLFIPIIRETIQQVTGDVAADPIYIRTTNAIRQFIISQEDSVLGEVGDILRGFKLKGDYRDIIGPTPITLSDLLLRGEFGFGGAAISSNKAHVALNFQRYGKLSQVLNPAQDSNLRFEISALPSVTGVAAGGTSQIRVTSFELFRDPAVTAPVVPFAY